MTNGNGWIWARVREGGNSLGYGREIDQRRALMSGLKFWWYTVYGFEVVIMI